MSNSISEQCHTVQQVFVENNWTLSIAESCTGGSISSALTLIPGASQYFLGSIISYSNDLKITLLNVSTETIKRYGSVSEECAKEMVEGLIQRTNSDFGIAVTGVAGPSGGSPEKPVGTVWAAIMRKDKVPHVWKFQASGNRQQIIESAVKTVLAELLLEVTKS